MDIFRLYDTVAGIWLESESRQRKKYTPSESALTLSFIASCLTQPIALVIECYIFQRTFLFRFSTFYSKSFWNFRQRSRFVSSIDNLTQMLIFSLNLVYGKIKIVCSFLYNKVYSYINLWFVSKIFIGVSTRFYSSNII